MIGKIEIIMVQERDVFAARQSEAVVVGTGLMAGPVGQIHKADTRVVERGNAFGGIVGAGIADHDELPVGERRIADALHRVSQRVGSVVGRDDDGNGRRRGMAANQCARCSNPRRDRASGLPSAQAKTDIASYRASMSANDPDSVSLAESFALSDGHSATGRDHPTDIPAHRVRLSSIGSSQRRERSRRGRRQRARRLPAPEWRNRRRPTIQSRCCCRMSATSAEYPEAQ